ncbi:DUF6056 family protein [Francisella orientalis]|uniref:Uncharacterized protein n=1 Tax=Francisella orientalis TaxID=299583 RepID=A0AAP6X6K7_9GAMM|nr:DUF6056 family protein [Francisella orientalis]AHB98730.1 hypothetical protein M973_07905 [Francisella orientalis LADL 07-285A]AKN85985.1 hypothetical protein FNO12_1423 [Francisella orientalis FNO12]AKN87523.1 Hypothetical protein FNO24_1425 [Francisella orientalis FNO24]AKN89061.1 Hypothetical protein FNO190_1423 [Francisella orientalis]AKU05820.1 Hypothetical protein FNO01_1423 [Francisella orientalis]
MKISRTNVIIAVLIIAFFFVINYLQPLRADDFGRAYTDALDKGFIIYLRGIASNYIHWTGRISAQALIYLFLSKKYIHLSVFLINIINSLCFYLFVLYSYKIVRSKIKVELLSKDFLIYFFFFVFLFYQIGFIANVVWKTAAVQYFWGITLLVIFYYISIVKDKQHIWFSLFTGFFIGLYNEIFVGVAIILCFAYFLNQKLSQNEIGKNILYFFIACVVGGIILIVAPGNYVRLNIVYSEGHVTIFSQVINLVTQIVTKPGDTLVPMLMLLISLVLIFTNKNITKKASFIYGVATASSIFVLTPVAKSYDLNQRVLLIYDAVFFIIMMQQFYNHSTSFILKLRFRLNSLSWVFLVLLVIQLTLMVSIYFEIYKFERCRNILVAYYQQNNISDPTLPIIPELSQITFIDDITSDENAYNNDAYAKFYDFDRVYGKELG